jgi:RES domain-containing protein
LDVITATHEAYYNFVDYGFSLSAIRPRVLAGATAKLQAVFDLTDPDIRQSIGFSFQELVGEDWRAIQDDGEESWTQAIGRGARTAGFEALLVPSARCNDGRNMVVFPNRLLAGSTLLIQSPEELPPHPDEWP